MPVGFKPFYLLLGKALGFMKILYFLCNYLEQEQGFIISLFLFLGDGWGEERLANTKQI